MQSIKIIMRILVAAGCIISGQLHAQSADTVTNASVIKMVKANLDDELVLDVIQTSVTRFDLSPDAIKSLRNANVSDKIIMTMKEAGSYTEPSTEEVKHVDKQADENISGEAATESRKVTGPAQSTSVSTVRPTQNPEPVAKADDMSSPKPEMLNYVIPVAGLVKYYESSYGAMVNEIARWDRQIKDSLKAINVLNGKILDLEEKLRVKKNADSKIYSQEITQMQKGLATYRAAYKRSKNNMIACGEMLQKRLKDLSSEMQRSIDNEYGKVCQSVKSYPSNPSEGMKAAPAVYPVLTTIPTAFIDYLSPVTEMLAWHRNEIDDIHGIVDSWNEKVRLSLKRDDELKKQLEPLRNSQNELKSDPRKNKAELSALKKQIAALEKEQKQNADKMQDEARLLSETLRQKRTSAQDSVKQRFDDIISNIAYTFTEKLNL